MCGIVGFLSLDSTKDDLLNATDKLYKRGPDNRDVYFRSPIGLGHTRLSIIDLSTGNQPLMNHDESLVLVFNGEIYNYRELREELKLAGCEFTTKGDAEVILKAYEVWGLKKALSSLEGMFAFALWDERIKTLFVVRDRYGEKPVYYTKNKNGFFFGSELKSLSDHYSKERIDKIGLNLFFSLTYIPAPFTIYENIYKLEPGEYLQVEPSGRVEKIQFYDIESIVAKSNTGVYRSYDDAKAELRKLLFRSVEERMISDVPIGSFLSGGIDSSVVSAIMAKKSSTPIKTFSIGFKEKEFDESDRAARVAKHIGSEHSCFILDHLDLLSIVNETLSYFDEPFGDSSAIPSMMVAKLAKRDVTVVLTGDCADELFGGYNKYLAGYYSSRYNAIPKYWRKFFERVIGIIPHTKLTNLTLRKTKKIIKSSSLKTEDRYAFYTNLGFQPGEKEILLNPEYNLDVLEQSLLHYNKSHDEDDLTRTFYSDIKLVLEGDMLAKVDRSCMMNSIEARVPFLDSRLVDFSFQLPHHFKIQGKNKKRILKDTFSDLLPKETLSFSKKGFSIPIGNWFKKELKAELLNVLRSELLEKQAIFDKAYVKQLTDNHIKGKENNEAKLWLLYVFQKWYLQKD